jgi:hypothetical protein
LQSALHRRTGEATIEPRLHMKKAIEADATFDSRVVLACSSSGFLLAYHDRRD